MVNLIKHNFFLFLLHTITSLLAIIIVPIANKFVKFRKKCKSTFKYGQP